MRQHRQRSIAHLGKIGDKVVSLGIFDFNGHKLTGMEVRTINQHAGVDLGGLGLGARGERGR